MKILCRAPLRLAKLAVDEAYLGRREGATAQLAQVAERGVDGDPLAELVPGCFRIHLGEVVCCKFGSSIRTDWVLVVV